VIDALLSRLQRVKRTGPGRWLASCPTPAHEHGDRHPSLGIRETEDGRVLLRCYAFQCEPSDIVGAVGLDLADLFPPRSIEHAPRERRPFLPSDVFEVARFEISITAIIATDMHKQRTVSEGDYERLFTVIKRLNQIAEAAYGRD